MDAQLQRSKAPKTQIEEQLDALTHRLESAEAQSARWQREAANLEEILEAERAKVAQLKRKLDIAESGPEKLTKKEINFWRAKAEEIDIETRDYRSRLAALRQELLDRDTVIERLATQAAASPPELHELPEYREESQSDAATSDELKIEIETLRRQIASFETELTEAHTLREALKAEVYQAQEQLAEQQRNVHEAQSTGERVRELLTEREHRLVELSAELEQLRAEVARSGQREQQLRDAATQLREQIAGFETELKEEKENTDNFSELANARREQITKLNEQVEEANERYEEAKWRLGKAQYFERLVKRRKGVIKGLLAALRAKTKANIALKAGLDGLRTFKATAEVNQQKLLARIDSLKADLEEAEETITRHHGATVAKEQLVNTESRVKELETRLNAQAELIQALEADLKTSKAMQKSGDDKNTEIERLHQELEMRNQELATKDELLGKLQVDADDQQRRLAKLRGSESESMRLKAISEKDRGSIDALEREVAQLRDALARQSASSNGTGEHRYNAELARLMNTIKEHEATIKKLSETAEAWKRKYQFLATDAPEAYKTAAEK
ncbi:MAG TPA: hypothetical protein VJA26_16975 [Gammaproteobacteria bacterium]|nr:hypothetical protein [Gammaproteobacteria bacterium]